MKYIGIALVAIIMALGIVKSAEASTYNVEISMGSGIHVVHTGWEDFGGDTPDRYTFMGRSQQFTSIAELCETHTFLKGMM